MRYINSHFIHLLICIYKNIRIPELYGQYSTKCESELDLRHSSNIAEQRSLQIYRQFRHESYLINCSACMMASHGVPACMIALSATSKLYSFHGQKAKGHACTRNILSVGSLSKNKMLHCPFSLSEQTPRYYDHHYQNDHNIMNILSEI